MAFPVVWDLAIIRYSLTNKQPQQRGEIHLAVAMYWSKYAVFRQKILFENRPKAQYL